MLIRAQPSSSSSIPPLCTREREQICSDQHRFPPFLLPPHISSRLSVIHVLFPGGIAAEKQGPQQGRSQRYTLSQQFRDPAHFLYRARRNCGSEQNRNAKQDTHHCTGNDAMPHPSHNAVPYYLLCFKGKLRERRNETKMDQTVAVKFSQLGDSSCHQKAIVVCFTWRSAGRFQTGWRIPAPSLSIPPLLARSVHIVFESAAFLCSCTL